MFLPNDKCQNWYLVHAYVDFNDNNDDDDDDDDDDINNNNKNHKLCRGHGIPPTAVTSVE